MPEFFHIKIKKAYAASLIEHLLNEDAIEEIKEKEIELTPKQKEAIDKELIAISSDENYLLKWDDIKDQITRNG